VRIRDKLSYRLIAGGSDVAFLYSASAARLEELKKSLGQSR